MDANELALNFHQAFEGIIQKVQKTSCSIVILTTFYKGDCRYTVKVDVRENFYCVASAEATICGQIYKTVLFEGDRQKLNSDILDKNLSGLISTLDKISLPE